MNIFECGGCVTSVGGAIIVGQEGYSLGGPIGAVVGVPLGAVGGYATGVVLVLALFCIGSVADRFGEWRRLRGHFGRYWSPQRTGAWEKLTSQLPLGGLVTGKVLHRLPHGIFVDTGHGFPAWLADMDSEEGIHEFQPLIGETVSATVLRLNADRRFIELTQRDGA